MVHNDGEASMADENTNPTGEPAEAERPPQFSLGTLLLFVTACSFYFSQFTFIPVELPWRVTGIVAVVGTWGVLGAFYGCRGSLGTLFIHGFLPTFATIACCVGFGRPPVSMEQGLVHGFVNNFVSFAWLMNLGGFPVWFVAMLLSTVKRTEPVGPHDRTGD